MSWNPFKTKIREAIKITKIYDGLPQLTEYRIDSPTKIKEIVNHINNHPTIYINALMKKDSLEAVPTLQILEINEQMPNNESIRVVADVQYVYNAPSQNEPKSFTIGGLKIIAVLLFIFACLGVFTLVTMQMQHDQTVIDKTCFMYLKNGEPESIEIEGVQYNLNKDGTLDDIDNVFLNPYHRQILLYERCVKINLK